MLINLTEIPDEGRSFKCSEKTDEFSEALFDLIGNEPHSVDFFIQPTGNIYQVTGKIHTHQKLQCTRCLKEFDRNLDEPINELLVPGKEMPRTGRETKVNHTSELQTTGPSSTVVQFPNFDATVLVRDIVALAQPEHPICSEDCKGICQHCGKNLNEGPCKCTATEDVAFVKKSPFEKLREIKFN